MYHLLRSEIKCFSLLLVRIKLPSWQSVVTKYIRLVLIKPSCPSYERLNFLVNAMIKKRVEKREFSGPAHCETGDEPTHRGEAFCDFQLHSYLSYFFSGMAKSRFMVFNYWGSRGNSNSVGNSSFRGRVRLVKFVSAATRLDALANCCATTRDLFNLSERHVTSDPQPSASCSSFTANPNPVFHISLSFHWHSKHCIYLPWNLRFLIFITEFNTSDDSRRKSVKLTNQLFLRQINKGI